MNHEGAYLEELRLGADAGRREALKGQIRLRAAPALEAARARASHDSASARPSLRPFQRGVIRWRRRTILWQLAAVFLIAILWRPVTGELRSRLTAAASGEYVTAAGERMELTLDDGTRVTLGASSRLRVVSNLEGRQRELRLDGFALLDVAHDPTRPFVVHAGQITTRVLGTRFVIRAYRDEENFSVAVAEGRVAVVPEGALGQTGVLLSPGQVGRIGEDGMLEVKQDKDEVGRLVRSAHGPLHYTDVPLSMVLDEMERLYPVQFVVHDSAIARQLLTLRLSGDRLEDVVNAIALAVGARHEQRADTVTFYPR